MPNQKLLALTIAIVAALALAQTTQPPVQPTWAMGAPDPASWYMTVRGVLNSDRYGIYPYNVDHNLTIGFSRYGELIDGLSEVSLLYHNVDVFAPDHDAVPPTIPKNLWFQGWLMEIRYRNTIHGVDRRIVVTAQFADLSTSEYGGPWIAVEQGTTGLTGDPNSDLRLRGRQYTCGGSPVTCSTFGSPMWSGRKSIAYSWDPVNGQWVVRGIAPVFQSDITVLYEDDRRFIAKMRIDITDQIAPDTPALQLVNMTIIIDFNKVNKYVTVIKEVQSVLDSKYGVVMNIQLSDRGEIDLGNRNQGYNQYLHFFTEGTCGTFDTLSEGRPTVYSYGPWGRPAPALGAPLSCFNPLAVDDVFDVLQSVNTAVDKVFFAAFWPVLNDWDIYGWDVRGRPLVEDDPHRIDYTQAPIAGMRPYYIAEWDFTLVARDVAGVHTFRAVSVYGIVDNNGVLNTANYNTLIHPEVLYFLMQVFNPYVLTGEGVGLVEDDFIQHSRIRLYNRFNVNTPTATFPLRYNAPLFGTPSPITYVQFG